MCLPQCPHCTIVKLAFPCVCFGVCTALMNRPKQSDSVCWFLTYEIDQKVFMNSVIICWAASVNSLSSGSFLIKFSSLSAPTKYFSSDPAVSSSIFVEAEREENLINRLFAVYMTYARLTKMLLVVGTLSTVARVLSLLQQLQISFLSFQLHVSLLSGLFHFLQPKEKKSVLLSRCLQLASTLLAV